MKWRQMAFSFLREAQSDVHAAEVLLAEKEFARSVEHSQHAVEKLSKLRYFMMMPTGFSTKSPPI